MKDLMRTRSFELALILLTFAAIGRSQPAQVAPAGTDAPAAVEKPAAPADAAQEPAAVATGAIRNKDTLTVDFPDEDIRTILRSVADLFELNLVVPESLQGKTSIKLHDVTWRQIFEVVLTPVGYTYVDDAGII
jgi:type IV pilus assembly protein PilQ